MHETNTSNVEATLNAHFRTALGSISVPSYFSSSITIVQNWIQKETTLPCFSIHHIPLRRSDKWQGRVEKNGVRVVRARGLLEINAWVTSDQRVSGQETWQAELRYMQSMVEQAYAVSNTVIIKDYTTPASPTATSYRVRLGDLDVIQTADDPNPAIKRRKIQIGYEWELRADLTPFDMTFSNYINGALPYPFIVNSAWAVSSGLAVGTPVEGSNLVTNGTFESWSSPTNADSWTEQTAGTSTVNQESSSVHGGTYAVRYDIDGSSSQARVFQGLTLASELFHIVRFWARGSDATPKATFTGTALGMNDHPARSLTTSYQEFIANGRTTSANPQIFPDSSSAAGKSVYYDDITLNALTLTSLIAVAEVGRADVITQAYWNIVSYTYAGAISCLDSATNPQNFVLAYTNGATIRLTKCVAGVYTDLILPTSITYVAGAAVEIRKSGTSFSLYYNGTIVGSAQTVSDTGIISNTIHGAFNCYSGNTLTRVKITSN